MTDLPREISPPPGLEDRTAAALRARGLLRATGRRWSVWPRVAAAVVIFAAGALTGTLWGNTAAIVTPSEPRFLLLLHAADAPAPPDEERLVDAYRAWAARLRDEGRSVTGERLSAQAIVVPGVTSPAAADVQGYFVVSAADLADAVAVARSSPHVLRGGRIVVRPIDTPAAR